MYPAPRAAPLAYPGRRPGYSFVLAKQQVYPFEAAARGPDPLSDLAAAPVTTGEAAQAPSLDDFLARNGSEPLASRYAVVGYGSNPVPGQLLSKFGPQAVVPVLRATMHGGDIVYNLISNAGYAFAELLIGPPAGSCEVAVTFLDARQLERMVVTEENYRIARSPCAVTLESGHVLAGGARHPLYVFAGFRRIWVPRSHDTPIAVAEIPAQSRTLPAMSQHEFLSLAIEEFGLRALGMTHPADLVARVARESGRREQSGKLKFDLQAAIQADPRSFPALADLVETVPAARDIETFSGTRRGSA